MLCLKGKTFFSHSEAADRETTCSEGAANLNDMKEMLANLPQYQEQREKVRLPFIFGSRLEVITWFLVLVTLEYGARMYGYLRAGQTKRHW